MIGRTLITLTLFSLLLETPDPPVVVPDLGGVRAEEGRGALLETDARAMVGLEEQGFSLARLFGARRRTNDVLAATPLFASLATTLERDVAELAARPTVGEHPQPNRPFRSSWLRDARAHFELTGVVHRLDRDVFEPAGSGAECGEVRLVYRLVLSPQDRPSTALPMTVNVVFPQDAGGRADCAAVARAWKSLPASGEARVQAIGALLRGLGNFTKVETNLQNLHGPALREHEDDHAEYLLRSFERRGNTLVPAPLLDTPRPDLDAKERQALAQWIRDNFASIDRGSFVVPDRFLATRAISVAPRGGARSRNRIFRSLFDDDAAFADLPYASAALVKSPRGLLRRLDQASCTGCHETHAIAGFHLLGEDRNPDARFNALANGRSRHFDDELAWRRVVVDAAAAGEPRALPRPFADHPSTSAPGGLGDRCGLSTDATFASWTCGRGLRCRDLYGDDVGICAPDDGNHEGDACEDARVQPQDGPDGDRVNASPKEGCTFDGRDAGPDACSPNHYGFPGGMCSDECAALGRAGDGKVCADLPAAGYETDCFPTRQPIERCLLTHVARRTVRYCDGTHACRDDYACARVPGLGPREGACVPPYFVFQARVDGPMLDR